MVALTDKQLEQVMTIAASIPHDLRDAFPRTLADKLHGLDIGDGELHRLAIAARQLVMWRSRPMVGERTSIFCP
jgi:hypothetical protein